LEPSWIIGFNDISRHPILLSLVKYVGCFSQELEKLKGYRPLQSYTRKKCKSNKSAPCSTLIDKAKLTCLFSEYQKGLTWM